MLFFAISPLTPSTDTPVDVRSWGVAEFGFEVEGQLMTVSEVGDFNKIFHFDPPLASSK